MTKRRFDLSNTSTVGRTRAAPVKKETEIIYSDALIPKLISPKCLTAIPARAPSPLRKCRACVYVYTYRFVFR